mmetsp:Transcript_52077/g.108719  ORF Transcript_52077/g.108719 Transcript_52077/m.108719 type:complete len:90 (-) Transcript_52077:135-404(-)
MKLMNALCHSHLSRYQCLAGKASPMSDDFSLKFLLKDDSARKIVSTLLHTVCIQIKDHDLPIILTGFRFSHPSRFWVECSFPSYLFCPA